MHSSPSAFDILAGFFIALEQTVGLIKIECTDRFANARLGWEVFSSIFQTFTIKDLSFVCQFYNFILGCTEKFIADVIIETTLIESAQFTLNFNTGVADFTHIQDWVRSSRQKVRSAFVIKQFFGLIVIVVHGYRSVCC